MDFTIEQTGLLKQPPDKISRQMEKNVSVAINDVVRPAQDMVRNPIPKGKSGLYESIKLKRATIGNSEGTISSNHPLLDVVENKTDPHEIKPRNSVSDMSAGTARKALHFKFRGKFIFATKVDHPGTPGKHSWEHAFEFIELALGPAIQKAVEAAMDGQDYSSGPKVYVDGKTALPLAYNPLQK